MVLLRTFPFWRNPPSKLICYFRVTISSCQEESYEKMTTLTFPSEVFSFSFSFCLGVLISDNSVIQHTIDWSNIQKYIFSIDYYTPLITTLAEHLSAAIKQPLTSAMYLFSYLPPGGITVFSRVDCIAYTHTEICIQKHTELYMQIRARLTSKVMFPVLYLEDHDI